MIFMPLGTNMRLFVIILVIKCWNMDGNVPVCAPEAPHVITRASSTVMKPLTLVVLNLMRDIKISLYFRHYWKRRCRGLLKSFLMDNKDPLIVITSADLAPVRL